MPILSILIFIVSTAAVAWEATEAAGENVTAPIQAVYRDYQTRQERSKVSVRLTEDILHQMPVYYLRQHGQGSFDRYRDVTWGSESTLVKQDSWLIPLSTTHTIRDAANHIVAVGENYFDYQQKKIRVRLKDLKAKTSQEFEYPLKGLTVDYTMLSTFLERYAADVTPSQPKNFYLLTREPRLYKVNVKFVAEEILNTPSGQIRAVKLRLIADMGILDNVFDEFVPPTFMWFEKTTFRWLKYEGLETGRHSARVIADVAAF